MLPTRAAMLVLNKRFQKKEMNELLCILYWSGEGTISVAKLGNSAGVQIEKQVFTGKVSNAVKACSHVMVNKTF